MKKLGLLTIILIALAGNLFGQTPTTEKGWFEQGFNQRKEYKFAESVTSFTECLRINPNSAPCYTMRAQSYWNLNKHDLAIMDFDKSIQINPNNAQLYFNRGEYHFSWRTVAGRADLAMTDLNNAIRIKPDFADAFSIRAQLFLFKKDVDSAITDLNRAIGLNPKFAAFYQLRAKANCQKGNLRFANQDEGKVKELGGSVDNFCIAQGKTIPSYDQIQISLVSLGTKDAAWEIINEMLPKYPEYYLLYAERARLYNREGKRAEARKDIARSFELNPDNTEAKLVLETIELDEKLSQSTNSNTTKTVPVKPVVKVPTKRENAEKIADKAESLLNEGAGLLEQGKVTDAEAKLKLAFPEINKAAEADETYAKPQVLLGMYYFLFSMSPNTKNVSQMRSLAIIAYDKAVKLDANNSRAYFGKGLIFEMSGNKSEAKSNYQKALQVDPNESAAKEGLKRVGN